MASIIDWLASSKRKSRHGSRQSGPVRIQPVLLSVRPDKTYLVSASAYHSIISGSTVPGETS